MSTQNTIRAWKDEEYRRSLSEAERESMPPNPAGLPELSDAQLKQVAGGLWHQVTYIPCLVTHVPVICF
ncbi:MAG: mersacidin/lichenicidin family type 2 lantibiotic [Bryobacteraceae bacterium]